MKPPLCSPACLRFTGALLLAASFSLTARADYSSTVLSQGPLGYWRLNETTQPPVLPINATNRGSLGSAADGSILSGATRGEPGPLAGSADKSYRFTNPGWSVGYFGTHVDMAQNAALNPNGPFTVEFWAQPSSLPPDLFCAVASLDNSQNSGNAREGYLFYVDGGGSRWQFRMGGLNGYGANTALGGSLTVGAWHHIVGTFDGSFMRLYVNGVQASTNVPVAAGSFTPNTNQPFRLGATTLTINGPNRTFDGWVSEVAVYGTALSADTVRAHFDAATTNAPGYANMVLSSAPVGYWRLNEPGDPPAANLGTLGSAGKGSYIYNCVPGVASIRPPTYPGLDAGNDAVSFSGTGTGGYVSLPQLNVSNNAYTITGWINANGSQAPATGLILNHNSVGGAGLVIDVAGGLALSYNWDNDNATYNWPSGLSLPDSDWAFVSLIIQSNQAAIFVANDTNFSTFTGATNTPSNGHAYQAVVGPTLIGADLTPTAGTGPAFFNGSIDEVAIFGRALGVGEVYTEYAAAIGGVPPVIFSGPNPPATPLFEGDTLVLTVDAGGTPALGYQWRKGGVALAGATSSTYTKANILAATDNGNYDVIVSNAFNSVTSGAAAITIQTLAVPAITQAPVGRSLYPGGTLNMSVSASGGQLAYQWLKNNSAVAGATASSYVVPNVASGDAGSYTVTVTNRLGTASSTPPAVVTVTTPAAGSFEAAVVADAPQAWWRLDDSPGSTNMLDALGRHDGTYVGTPTLGIPGVVASGGDTAVTFDGASYGTVPYSPLLNSSAFTIECWVKTGDLTDDLVPVGSHYSGKGWYFQSAVPGAGQWAGGVAVGGTEYYVPSNTSADSMQSNQWTYLVMTFESSASGLLFYINGQWDNQGWADFDRNTAGPFVIGARGVSSGQAADSFWKGQVDEVVFYTNSLTLAQVQAHYAAALYGSSSKPVFKLQPQAQTAAVGSQVTFHTIVEGSLPISLQWSKDSVALTGETNDTLVITNATAANSGSYQLVATNTAGSTPSTPATLSILPTPTFANLTNGLVLHLKLDNTYTDSSPLGNNGIPAGTPVFITGHVGSGAVQLNSAHASSIFNYIAVPSTNQLAFGASDSFSVAFWINYNGTPDDLPMIGNSINSTFQKGWVFADSGGQLEWTLVANDNTSVIADPVGGPKINDLKWHNVVASFDRTIGVANTYVDGVQIDSRPILGLGSLDNGNQIALGQDPTGAYTVDGSFQIDDVGIWRRALSTYDAQSVYIVGQTGKSFDTPGSPPPTLSFSLQGGVPKITYTGTLQSSATVNGTYNDVNGASSPYTIPTAAASMQFYRARN